MGKNKGKGNLKNLRPVQSKEEARARGVAGGIRSGEVRREKRTMREELIALLNAPSSQRKGLTVQKAGLLSLLEKYQAGDLPTAVFVRDSIGEKPSDKTEITGAGGAPINPVSINVNFDEGKK